MTTQQMNKNNDPNKQKKPDSESIRKLKQQQHRQHQQIFISDTSNTQKSKSRQ